MSSTKKISYFVYAAIIVAAAFMLWSIWNNTKAELLEVRGDTLFLQSSYVTEAFPIRLVDVENIRMIELTSDSPYRPVERIVGASTLTHGLYRLANGERAFVNRRGRGDLWLIPIHKRFDIIYRLKEPQTLIQQIRQSQAKQEPHKR